MTAGSSSVHLGARFEAALVYANQVHGGQCRKGTTVPYVAHLLGVTSLVLEDGGDEDQAIGALLHDAAEDQGGADRLADIRARFGEHVARIVDGCSDTLVTPKPPWSERKAAYLARLESEPPDAHIGPSVTRPVVSVAARGTGSSPSPTPRRCGRSW